MKMNIIEKNMREQMISATIEALQSVCENRFYQTERGYQGRFYCALQKALDDRGILNGDVILELEYQKSAKHGLNQRPDIILHIPAELNEGNREINNFAVYALKRRASRSTAQEDFGKLDEMFERLNYPIGIFINIDSTLHHINNYSGNFKSRIIAFSVKRINNTISIKQATWVNDIVNEIIL